MAALVSPVPQLTCDDLLRLRPSLQAHPERFRPLFPRRDQGASFLAYAEGLLSGERRKSVERMVLREPDGDMNQVRRPRYFAADSPWSDRPFPERYRQAVGAEPGTREGVLLVDTTDMPKQGAHSVGGLAILRSAGWVANCQAGVFPAEAWTGDEAHAERRQRCGVPEEALAFRAKPQLALELLAEGALGELRRGLRPVGRLPGRGGGPGLGLHGGGAGRHAGLAGAAADRRASHAGAGGPTARGGLDAVPGAGGQPRAGACRLRHPTGGGLPRQPAGPRRLARVAPLARGGPDAGLPLPCPPPPHAGPL